MTERIDLKKIERKAYTSYHQDGLIDVFAALFILGFTPWLFLEKDMAWMGWIGGWTLGLTIVPAYAVAKKFLTVPRIGLVKFAPHRARALQSTAVVVFSLSALLGVVAFVQTASGGTPSWLLFAIEHYMLVIGLSVATSFFAVGYTFRVSRTYVYALLALAVFLAGEFLHIPLLYCLFLLGTPTLLVGLAMLIRFGRRYPRSVSETMGDSGSEER